MVSGWIGVFFRLIFGFRGFLFGGLWILGYGLVVRMW